MDADILKELVSQLTGTQEMLVVMDSGGAVSEMHARGMKPPEFEHGWAKVESRDWHVHLNMKTVDGVQFVEAEDHGHEGIPKLYYVRLSDAEGHTLIRFYFPNPWLDEDEKATEFQPDKLGLFEEFRDRYVGRGDIVFVRRPQQSGTPQ